MSEKTFTLELTKQEGQILWQLLEWKATALHSGPTVHESNTAQAILFKITAAVKAAEMGMFSKSGEAE